MAFTTDEEAKLRKLLAVEEAKSALLKKYTDKASAMDAAKNTINEQYNQEIVSLEKAVEDAQKAITDPDIIK